MNILILKTFPLSFDDWNKVGIIERETKIYKIITKKMKISFIFFSFGNKNEYKYKKKIHPLNLYALDSKIKNYYLKLFFSIFIPLLHKNIFKKIDVIQSNQFWGSWIGLIAAKIYKKKFILREGFQFYYFQTKLNKRKLFKLLLIKILSKLIYNYSDYIICTSLVHKNFIISNFKIPKNKIFIIPNFIDTNIFKKNNNKKNDRLLLVGRLNYQKNIELVIKAISNSNYVLDIIGHGDNNKYKNLSNKYNSKVNFHKNIPNFELVNYYNSCSFYIISSHFEGNPKSLLEAMSCECAIIATSSPGIIENIDNDSAFIIDINNEKQLKNVIEKYSNDFELKKLKGINSRKKILINNEINLISNKFINIYKSIIDG